MVGRAIIPSLSAAGVHCVVVAVGRNRAPSPLATLTLTHLVEL
jgi:hypothetical protein